jgi:predicted dinucleotide-binding enzyme
MKTLGIIGSGNIGAAVARLAVAAEIPVVVANSRGPESLADLVAELGPLATAGTVEDAAEAGDVVVLSVPLTAVTAIDPAPLRGKTVLDTSNYYPSRDGRIAELDDEKLTTSELVQRHFAGVPLVKAFNNILAHHIPQLARPAGAPDRSALPIAGESEQAKTEAAALIDRLGYDTVNAGSFADSWRFEPDAAAYTRLYLADPATPDERLLQAPAGPTSAAELRSALDEAERVRVADRAF